MFIPDVDLTDKPWFSTKPDLPSLDNLVHEKMTGVLASLSSDARGKMGYELLGMLVDCQWNAQPCDIR